MDQKQGLIKILEIIKDRSSKAQFFLDAINDGRMTPELMDKLTLVIKEIISNIKDKETKSKFQEMIDYLEVLKQKEEKSRQEESVELEQLEHEIDKT